MSNSLEERACQLAVYMIETGATVRAAAQHFGISKSTVHKDIQQRLKQYNPRLYAAVRQVLDWNRAQRHLRGGEATRQKYLRKARDIAEIGCNSRSDVVQSDRNGGI